MRRFFVLAPLLVALLGATAAAQPNQWVTAQLINGGTWSTDGYLDIKTTYSSQSHTCVEVEYQLMRNGVVLATTPGFIDCRQPPGTVNGLEVERVTFTGQTPQAGDVVVVHATFTGGGTTHETANIGL